jgi:hypothetical protein
MSRKLTFCATPYLVPCANVGVAEPWTRTPGKVSVRRIAERSGSEVTAVSSVRKKYLIYLSYATLSALPLPPCLRTAPRPPFREARLTGRG